MSIYRELTDVGTLKKAWKKVKKNKPATGADNMTYEEFEDNVDAELAQLSMELEEHTYEVFPVKLANVKQEEKIREISLYTMRDKTVQNALLFSLTELYDASFSKSTYAYRSDKSALIALDDIGEAVTSGEYKFAWVADIKGFFEHIHHESLKIMLEQELKEDDVIELIMQEISAPAIHTTGELIEKQVGLYLGSSISPILSNLYLREFDYAIEREGVFYIRYADDILILSYRQEDIDRVRNMTSSMLNDLGLSLNIDKTYERKIEDGFEFLGYAFDDDGKHIPNKAMDKLSNSLEDVWLTMVGYSLEDRLKQGAMILNGWEQYFREDKNIGSIYEYVVIIHEMRHEDGLREMAYKREFFNNQYLDICKYLLTVWEENGWKDLTLLEYEQYFGIAEDLPSVLEEKYYSEIVGIYKELLLGETEELLVSLMQAYSDVHEYRRAERVMVRINSIKETPQVTLQFTSSVKEENAFSFDKKTLALYEDLFIGREDMYVRELLMAGGERRCEFIPEPLTKEVIHKHLAGEETVGTYLIRNNDTVKYIVFDIDIAKKTLISDGEDKDLFVKHLNQAAEITRCFSNKLAKMGLKTYIEFSGYRGYHLWLFFSEWIPLRYAYSLIEIILGKVKNENPSITIEAFPIKNRKKAGHSGQNIKLPYAIHLNSGNRSYFCNADLTPVQSMNDFLSGVVRYSLPNIKKVIGANISDVIEKGNFGKELIEINYEKLPQLSDSIKDVLNGCNLMKYLVHKSMATGYLSHFERLSILYVFGHLGEEGKEFVHTVMSFTINYNHNTTDHFIERMPANPISCIKLRDEYKQVSAAYGCSCRFKRTKHCYPSPVIHALRDNDEDNREITIPISKTLSNSKREEMFEELNNVGKAQELANHLVELKKQKRGLEKAISKTEKELSIVFDNADVECMEIDIGLLIRKKVDDKYEWHIEF